MGRRCYGEPHPAGGRIARVRFGSPAWRAGLRGGDVVLAVDGRPVADVLDWQWATAQERFEVEVARRGERRSFTVFGGARPTGVEFEAALFDGVRECANACSFCFVRQLPQGLRPSLYVRDDDFRLSFLHGNFVTLTNLSEADVERIILQRLSPLYVSLHAADPAVRRRLIAPPMPDRALERLETLCEAGIEIHVQIVAVPGVNDGDVLEETLSYLSTLEAVSSVGVVPLGFTRHQRRFSASFDVAGARAVIAIVEAAQARSRAARGRSWAYAADEFYLRAGASLPDAAAYDGYPQYENGIGLVRSFLDDLAANPLPQVRGRVRPVLVTGTMFAPILDQAARAAGVEVLPVLNRFLGGNVAVTGLLSGADIARAIATHGAQGTYLVPDVVLNSDGLTLDDMAVRDIERRSEARVRIVGSTARDLARALARL